MNKTSNRQLLDRKYKLSTLKTKLCLAVALMSLLATAQSTKTKLACVGNSITYGYTLANPSTQSYPSQLQAMLGTTNWTVGNYGVSARTMLKKGDRPYWNETAYTNALNSQPNIVMIELGTNDAKTTNWTPYGSQFVTDYKAMIQSFRNLNSKPEIWIGLLPPGQNTGWTIYSSYVKDTVNSKIIQVALEAGIGLIDIYAAFNGDWTNRTYFNADGIHPTTAGATIMAQKVKEMITWSKPTLTYNNKAIKASSPATSYQWYFNGSRIPDADGGTLSEFTPTKSGAYKVSLQLNSTTETRVISEEIYIQTLFSGIDTNIANLKIFNHSGRNGTIVIEFDQPTFQFQGIKLYDLGGKNLITQHITGLSATIDLGLISESVYLLEIFSNGEKKQFKLRNE